MSGNASRAGKTPPQQQQQRRPTRLVEELAQHDDRYSSNPPPPKLQKQVLEVLGVEELNDHFISPLDADESFSQVGWKKPTLLQQQKHNTSATTPGAKARRHDNALRPQSAMATTATSSSMLGNSPVALRERVLRERQRPGTPNDKLNNASVLSATPQRSTRQCGSPRTPVPNTGASAGGVVVRGVLPNGREDRFRHGAPIVRAKGSYASDAAASGAPAKSGNAASKKAKEDQQRGSATRDEEDSANLLSKYFKTGGNIDMSSYMRRMQAYQRALHSLEPLDDPAIAEHTVDTTFASLEGVGNRLSHMVQSLETGDDYLPSLAVLDGQETGGYFQNSELTRIAELEKLVARLLNDVATQQQTISRLESEGRAKEEVINRLTARASPNGGSGGGGKKEGRFSDEKASDDSEDGGDGHGDCGERSDGDDNDNEFDEEEGCFSFSAAATEHDFAARSANDYDDSGDVDTDGLSVSGGRQRRSRTTRMLSLFGATTALAVRRGTATRLAMIQQVKQNSNSKATSASGTQQQQQQQSPAASMRNSVNLVMNQSSRRRKVAIRRKPVGQQQRQRQSLAPGVLSASASTTSFLPLSQHADQRAESNKEGFTTERLRFIDEPPLHTMVRPSVSFPFVAPPRENVTFLAMRVPGMERLYERDSQQASRCMQIYVQIVEATVSKLRGYILQTEGDMYTAAFHDPISAAMCALQIQTLCVENDKWPAFLEDDPATMTARVELIKTSSGTFSSQVIGPDVFSSGSVGVEDEQGDQRQQLAKEGADQAAAAEGEGDGDEKKETNEGDADFGSPLDLNNDRNIITIWRGLRVAMALHQAQDPPSQLDLCSLKMHYYGYPIHYLRFLLSLALGGMIVANEELKEVIELYHIQLDDPLAVFHMWAVPPTCPATTATTASLGDSSPQSKYHHHPQGGGAAAVHDPDSGAHAAVKVFRLTSTPLFKRNDDFDVELGRLYPTTAFKSLTRELLHPSEHGEELAATLRKYLPPPRPPRDERPQRLKSGDFCVVYVCIPASLEMLAQSDEAGVAAVASKFISIARDCFTEIETPVTEVSQVKDRMLLLFVNPIEAVRYAMALFQRVFRTPWTEAGSGAADLYSFVRNRTYKRKVVSSGPPLIVCIHHCKLKARRSLFAPGCGSESLQPLPGTKAAQEGAAGASSQQQQQQQQQQFAGAAIGGRGAVAGDFVTGSELNVLWTMANTNPQASSITISETVYAYCLFQLKQLNCPLIEPCGLIPFVADYPGPMPVYNLTSMAFVGRCAVLRGLEDKSTLVKKKKGEASGATSSSYSSFPFAPPFDRNFVREYLVRMHRISIRAQPWILPGLHLLSHSDCINNPSLQSVITRTHFEKRKAVDAAERVHAALHRQYVDARVGWGGVENREALEHCENAMMLLYDDLMPSTTPQPTIRLLMFDLAQLLDSCGSGGGGGSSSGRAGKKQAVEESDAPLEMEKSVSKTELEASVRQATALVKKEKEAAAAAFDLERQFFQQTLRKMNSQILMTHQVIHFYFNGIKSYLAPLIDDAAPRVHDDDFIIQLVQTHRELERRMLKQEQDESAAAATTGGGEGGANEGTEGQQEGEGQQQPEGATTKSKPQQPRIAQDWKTIMSSTLEIGAAHNAAATSSASGHEASDYDVGSVCRSIVGHAFKSFVFLRTLSRRVNRIVESAADARPVNKVLAAAHLKEHTQQQEQQQQAPQKNEGKKKK